VVQAYLVLGEHGSPTGQVLQIKNNLARPPVPSFTFSLQEPTDEVLFTTISFQPGRGAARALQDLQLEESPADICKRKKAKQVIVQQLQLRRALKQPPASWKHDLLPAIRQSVQAVADVTCERARRELSKPGADGTAALIRMAPNSPGDYWEWASADPRPPERSPAAKKSRSRLDDSAWGAGRDSGGDDVSSGSTSFGHQLGATPGWRHGGGAASGGTGLDGGSSRGTAPASSASVRPAAGGSAVAGLVSQAGCGVRAVQAGDAAGRWGARLADVPNPGEEGASAAECERRLRALQDDFATLEACVRGCSRGAGCSLENLVECAGPVVVGALVDVLGRSSFAAGARPPAAEVLRAAWDEVTASMAACMARIRAGAGEGVNLSMLVAVLRVRTQSDRDVTAAALAALLASDVAVVLDYDTAPSQVDPVQTA
jgi:hypothetical protein